MTQIADGGGATPKVSTPPPKTETKPADKPADKPAAAPEATDPKTGTAQPEDKTELSPQAQETATQDITSLPPDIPISPPRTYSNVPGCDQEQCAEWVQRVFRENGRPLPVSGDAATLFPQNWGDGYQKQSNGQPGLSPQAGDILCWGSSDKNQWGHVAIIKDVHADGNPPYVTIIEANYGTNDGQHVPTRNIPYDPATNTIQQTGSCPVQGWIHPEGDHSLVNAPPGEPGNYVPQAQMPAAAPGGGNHPQAGVPGVNQGIDPGGQTHGNIPQVFNDNPVMSPTGVEMSQEVANMIMAAWQEVMAGNFNGPNIQKLEQWYKQQNPNPQDPNSQNANSQNPVMLIAANILMMAGKIVGPPGGMTPLGGGAMPGVAIPPGIQQNPYGGFSGIG